MILRTLVVFIISKMLDKNIEDPYVSSFELVKVSDVCLTKELKYL